jgi:single-stranded-DNA-specific exonuclease
VTLQLLWNRGLRSQDEIEFFLTPDYARDVHDPFLFKQMQQAVDRVFKAIKEDQVITVHGDYDADGVCGTTVLFETLSEIIEKTHHLQPTTYNLPNIYIPHREKEGYGLSVPTVEHLHKNHTTNLIITVDCGVSNIEAIDRAKELGIDTIVTDHHDIPEKLPDAILVHPKLEQETYPFKELSGTAVAFKLAHALIEEARKRGLDFPKGHEKWLLDLVAIATVTDVMKMIGENRALEKYGLLVMNKTKRPGLKALLEVAGLKTGNLDSWNIGWQIGPRINAAGRVNHASNAFELLSSKSDEVAERLANKLNEENKERQGITERLNKVAIEQIGDTDDKDLLVAVGEDWPMGIVGLVAGKLSHKHHRPVFVVSKKGEEYSASGRSVPELNITKALQAASEYLDHFGGHPQACGFSTSGTDRFNKAIEKIEEFVKKETKDKDMTPRIEVDAELMMDQIDWTLIQDLDKFKPYGQGNEQPLFLTRKLEVVAADSVGKDGQHMRLTLKPPKGGKMWKAIAFRKGDWIERLEPGQDIDLVYELGVNEWNGNKEIQIKVLDLQYAE